MISPKVGYVYDVRLKLHKELTDDSTLDSIDLNGKSLSQKKLQDIHSSYSNKSYHKDSYQANKGSYSSLKDSYSNKNSYRGSSSSSKYSSYKDYPVSSKKSYETSGWYHNDNSPSLNYQGNVDTSSSWNSEPKQKDKYPDKPYYQDYNPSSSRSKFEPTSNYKNDSSHYSSSKSYKNKHRSKYNTNDSSFNNDSSNSSNWPAPSKPINNYSPHISNANINATSLIQHDDPNKLFAIYSILDASGCLAKMTRIAPKMASLDQLRLFHTENHCEFVSSTSPSKLRETEEKYDSLFLNRESAYTAKLAAGSVIELCINIANGSIDSGIAITRPPDIHHGNGIQEAFNEDENILYISLHRHESGNFYPFSDEGSEIKIGKFDGVGRNVNIAWQTCGMGDGDYLYAFEKVVIPMAREFNPEFIIVAAGFDAGMGDPVGLCNVTPHCFSILTHLLLTLANGGEGGKLAMVLEGVYDLEVAANSALACVKSMLWMHFSEGIMPKQKPMLPTALATESDRENSSHTQKNEVPFESANFDPSTLQLLKLTKIANYLPNLNSFEPSKGGYNSVMNVLKNHKQYWKFLQDF
ncbi:Histone deacetylase HDA1 [Smittium culicis]|uniref:histone deacetylase n=1 Tax=Smittium culicis TaxID=133412 RepID=A0A1R1YTR5_9FUNG|nr:Histone deacetylase HDA1 [Smittium culicis]